MLCDSWRNGAPHYGCFLMTSLCQGRRKEESEKNESRLLYPMKLSLSEFVVGCHKVVVACRWWSVTYRLGRVAIIVTKRVRRRWKCSQPTCFSATSHNRSGAIIAMGISVRRYPLPNQQFDGSSQSRAPSLNLATTLFDELSTWLARGKTYCARAPCSGSFDMRREIGIFPHLTLTMPKHVAYKSCFL